MTPGDLDTGDRLLPAEEAAALAGIQPRTFHAYVARHRAPAADGQIGRTPVWRETTITQWLNTRADKEQHR